MTRSRITAAFCAFLLLISFAGQASSAANFRRESLTSLYADKFFRCELYFGMNKPEGGSVSDEDWDKFLETIVTPRFPSGFTVFKGFGQYKDSAQRIIREESRILVIFYPKKSRGEVDRKIEEIRDEYKKQFKQESVLRIDFVKSVNVRF